MTHHDQIQTSRGLKAVHASANPVAVLNEMQVAFEDFKTRHDNKVEGLQDQLDEINKTVDALRVGGVGPVVEQGPERVSAALGSFVRHGDTGPLAAFVNAPQAGMSVDSNPDGGYLVIPELGSTMNKRIHEISPMRQLARTVVVSTDSYEEINDLDEAGAAWVDEREARPDTDNPTLGKLIVPVHEMYAMPKVTQKLLDDALIDVGAWVVEKCVESFARKEGSAFIWGDGMLKPRGLLAYPTAALGDNERDWGTIEHINTGTSAGFGATSDGVDTLIDVTYYLKSRYRPNASWLMNRKTAATVRKMKDADGNLIWSQGLAEGQPDRLLGFPVVLDEEMPDIGADSLSIAFGDFQKAYLIVDRHGLRLMRDPYTDKPNVRFYTYKRVGGGMANSEAVKFIRFGTG
ncbi:MAG: phage major capsid protein [Ruegeria sp.]|nr:phage major capsid protein [Ruegeria sp.]